MQAAQPLRPKVFISYAREDSASADHLYEDLRCAGTEPWLDRKDLVPGQAWKSAILQAIRGSNFVIVLLSSHSVSKRGFVQKEIRAAIEVLDEHPENSVFLIPARLEKCDPSHERLRDLMWADLFPEWSTGFTQIVRVFSRAGYSIEHAVEPQTSKRDDKVLYDISVMESILVIESSEALPVLKRPYTVEQLVRDISLNRQLPKHRVEEQLLLLRPGLYQLIVAMRRPKRLLERTRIARFFGRHIWKRHMWRIVGRHDDTSVIEVGNNYLTVTTFPFYVADR